MCGWHDNINTHIHDSFLFRKHFLQIVFNSWETMDLMINSTHLFIVNKSTISNTPHLPLHLHTRAHRAGDSGFMYTNLRRLCLDDWKDSLAFEFVAMGKSCWIRVEMRLICLWQWFCVKSNFLSGAACHNVGGGFPFSVYKTGMEDVTVETIDCTTS